MNSNATMRSCGRTFPKIVAVMTAVLGLACFCVGCQYPATGQALAESVPTPTRPVAASLPERPSTPFPVSVHQPTPAARIDVRAATPSLATAHRSQSDADALSLETSQLPSSTPAPTPTPVPLADWVARNKDVPSELITSLKVTDWARDGIDPQEGRVVAALVALTAGTDPSPTMSEWFAMPFLHTVEPADDSALQALLSVQQNDPAAYAAIMDYETMRALADQWTPVIAALPGPRLPTRGRYSVPASLIDQLLDPDAATIQQRTISLPLAGPVTVAVVRTGPGSERSIERLVNAVSAAEKFMQEPFPIGHVTMLFADWPAGSPVRAINNHYSLTASTVLDVGDGDPMGAQSKYIIAHEIAHFYLTGHPDWLDEGVAELIALAATATDEDPYRPQWACELSESITPRELEALQLSPDQPDYSCNYAIGLRQLTDMRDSLGVPAFMRWLRGQYRQAP